MAARSPSPWQRYRWLASAFSLVALASVVLVGNQCVNLDANQRYATTTVTGSSLVTRRPPLPLFVVRIASNDLALEPDQAKLVRELLEQTEKAARPLAGARMVFLELLAAKVDAVQPVDPGSVEAAADRFVSLTEQAIPDFQSTTRRLHAALRPRQRAVLVELLRDKIAAWAASWEAPVTRDTALTSHRWVPMLADDDPGPALEELERDTAKAAREWTTRTLSRVTTDLANLDESARRRLAGQLRSDTLRD